ncbi:MAG: asparagine synthase (glutamine-hydrolyzing) [Oligoflexales bacterium]|nr:asparagine synthase (glutamine-hydrolyzing) [Oligoflexales bacterium]
MCGLVGSLVFSSSSFQLTEPLLVKMRDTMVHRGPDGSGLWISENKKVALAFRRLSIIDLSDLASQPMSSRDQKVHLVFNGEVYNHKELRAELDTLRKWDWKTDHSDTEVILNAYLQWGIDCVHKFRGMFAIALWDENTQNLWLVRDRLGIKPLYYSIHHGRVVFASEIKAILQDSEQKRELNENALFHYLSFLTTPAPQTLFEGIQKIPCGTMLKISARGEVSEYKYWDVLDHTKPLTGVSDQDIAEKVLAELTESVKLRKISDVPVGVFLSGGVDSSTNAALFSKVDQTWPIKTFSIAYKEDYASYKSELTYAREIAKLIGSEHHEKLLDEKDLLDFLPAMVKLQDEPIADPVCIPIYYVSKLAREHGIIVSQVGEGADELFWGYNSWKNFLKLYSYNDYPVPSFVKRFGLKLLSLSGQQEGLPYECLRRACAKEEIFWSGAEAFSQTSKEMLLSKRLNQKFHNYTSWEALRPLHDRFLSKAWEKTHLNWMSYSDLNLRLPELLLMRVDKMSMGVSLEARVPFLDYKFVELAMSIPTEVKTRNNVSKYILKKAVKGVIPDHIINRPKQGFNVPVKEWFMKDLGLVANREISEFQKKTDLFSKEGIEHLFRTNSSQNIWTLFNFVLWWKEYIES